MAVEDEIRQASEQFYAALNREINGDPGPMMEVWSHGSEVSTMHPLGGINVGWEDVRAGWEQAAQAISDGQVSLEDLVVLPLADDVAYTVGTEHGQAKFARHGAGSPVRSAARMLPALHPDSRQRDGTGPRQPYWQASGTSGHPLSRCTARGASLL